MSKEQTSFEKFGVDEETFKKSKDVLPTIDLGKLEEGSEIFVTILDNEPRDIKHKAKFGEMKGQEITSPVITVMTEKIERKDSDDSVISIPVKEKQTLWLSSKTLRMSLLKIFEENDQNLEGVPIKIKVTKATYKDFGENRCYVVTQL